MWNHLTRISTKNGSCHVQWRLALLDVPGQLYIVLFYERINEELCLHCRSIYFSLQYNNRSLCLLQSTNQFASRRTPIRVESTVYSKKRTCTNQLPVFVYRVNILILVAWPRSGHICNLPANESTMMHDDVHSRTCLQSGQIASNTKPNETRRFHIRFLHKKLV